MQVSNSEIGLANASAETRDALDKAERLDNRGQWDKALNLYDQILQAAVLDEDRWIQAYTMRKVGEIRRKRGDSLAALHMFRSSQNIFKKLGDRKSLSYLSNNIGLVYFGKGKWNLVKRYFGKALKIARAEGERKLEGQIFNNLGIMSQILGQEKKAIKYFEKALPCYEEIGFNKGITQTLNNIGMSYRDSQMWEKARFYYEKSLEKSKELNDLNLMGIASLNIAMVMIHLQQLGSAKEYCDQASSIFKELDDKLGIAESLICYGIISRRNNKPDQSERYFKKSIRINKKVENQLGLAEAYREIALLYQDSGKGKLVLQFLGKSLKVFQELQASRYIEDIGDKVGELEEIYFRITKEMGEEVESKDTYTYGHCQRVAKYSIMLAEKLGLSDVEKKAILVAAFLHDLGKVKIPREILTKPKKLAPDEYLIIMNHPAWGVEMLEQIEFPWEVKSLILHHQERFDGKGYPDGLEGMDIPLSARIISIADFFDALTTDRPYRRAMALDEAFSVMRREAGEALDPELMDLFDSLIQKKFPSGGDTLGSHFKIDEFVNNWNIIANGDSIDDKISKSNKKTEKSASS
jgi:putative nucleotidyltransferase with HDIG domain